VEEMNNMVEICMEAKSSRGLMKRLQICLLRERKATLMNQWRRQRSGKDEYL